ncbi:MAG TPA: hypothetical protein VJ652_22640 [Noviherbaspirillum sp.]|nr:hypothetical protein [Noviherbaspirillum sp.]
MNKALDIFREALWQVVDDQPRRQPAPVQPPHPWNSFFTFRYSYTEVSAHGGDAHVKRRETRFEDGKFITEECEGTVGRDAYDRMVEQTQQMFIEQMNQAMKMFYLPFGASRRPPKE